MTHLAVMSAARKQLGLADRTASSRALETALVPAVGFAHGGYAYTAGKSQQAQQQAVAHTAVVYTLVNAEVRTSRHDTAQYTLHSACHPLEELS